MRYRKYILKAVAFLFLLLLIQKGNVGLYLHYDLHTAKTSGDQHTTDDELTGINCSCIDDFLTPFAEAADNTVPVTQKVYNGFSISPVQSLRFSDAVFISLRAPPAC